MVRLFGIRPPPDLRIIATEYLATRFRCTHCRPVVPFPFEDRRISSSMRFDFGALSLAAKRQKILTLGADTLACGGIDRTTHGWLQERGIQVMANVQGEAEELLSTLLRKLNNFEGG